MTRATLTTTCPSPAASCVAPARNTCWNVPGTRYYAFHPETRPCGFYPTGRARTSRGVA